MKQTFRLEAHESVGENGSAVQAGTPRFLFSLSKDSEYEVLGNDKSLVDEPVGQMFGLQTVLLNWDAALRVKNWPRRTEVVFSTVMRNSRFGKMYDVASTSEDAGPGESSQSPLLPLDLKYRDRV